VSKKLHLTAFRRSLITLALSVRALLTSALLSGVLISPTALAQIRPDTSAPRNQRPTVLLAPNGVPLVNIQTPSAAGVSRNTYSQFDVQPNGAILNNSRTDTATQLGGWVQANPWLATGSARVILNEVNSNNPSNLNGWVEVAGSRAQVVVANPAGISCNGCGFINASKTTLATGTPIVKSGSLESYHIPAGELRIEGLGLDAHETNVLTILARSAQINAAIWAQRLKVITGKNDVSVDANGDVTTIAPVIPPPLIITPIPGSYPGRAIGNPPPAFALDTAYLGGNGAGNNANNSNSTNSTLTNKDSQIIVAGDINLSNIALNNQETKGTDRVQYDGTAQFTTIETCGSFGDSHCREWRGKTPYRPAPEITTIDLPTGAKYDNHSSSATTSNNSTANSITTSITSGNNALFKVDANAGSNPIGGYLVETDHAFTNYRTWLSSDYLLNALSYNPALMQKRLGDGYYEQSLIRDQVAQLTGRRFLNGYSNDEAQYLALLTSGKTFAEKVNLQPGIALTKEQIAQLTSDIVWLVDQTVTLADGSTTHVLVPQLYVHLQKGDLDEKGILTNTSLGGNFSGSLTP
jgi:filamentous hemagglutinin family protein